MPAPDQTVEHLKAELAKEREEKANLKIILNELRAQLDENMEFSNLEKETPESTPRLKEKINSEMDVSKTNSYSPFGISIAEVRRQRQTFYGK